MCSPSPMRRGQVENDMIKRRPTWTRHNGDWLTGLLVLCCLLIPPDSGHTGTIGPDAFGYVADDSASFDFQNISVTGVNVNAGDETTHGPISLGFTFRFYGNPYSEVYLSSNGWISFTVPGDADPSNDCPFPNADGQDNLIAGIWDDLDAAPTGAGVYCQGYIAGSCPYGGYAGACFIVQWDGVVHFGSTDIATFEIILFDNNEILVQFQDSGTESGSGSTTGIENSDGSTGLVYACNTGNSLASNSAILFKRLSPIHYVDDSASGTGDGTSWTNAFTNLQDALSVAAMSEQIWVAEGVYVPGAAETDTFQLVNGVEIYGGFDGESGTEGNFDEQDPTKFHSVLSGDIGGNDTTDQNGIVTNAANIAGQNSDHVVSSAGTDSSAVLDGFTITAGQADGTFPNEFGGGMCNVPGSPTLANLLFSGNTALLGGGMYNSLGSAPSLTNVNFSGNTATGTSGGGMANEDGGDPILVDCTLTGNSAVEDGGGMYSIGSSPTLTNVTFSNNTAGRGGGMHSDSGSQSLTNVTFLANSAGSGGGLSNVAANVNVISASFLGNSAESAGGGIYNIGSSPVLANASFLGNSAGIAGGGIYNSGGNPVLANALFSGNSAEGGGGGAIYNSGSSPTLTNITFARNSAGDISSPNGLIGDGGAIYNVNGSDPFIQNCILWDNKASGNGDQIFNDDFISEHIVRDSIIEGGCPGGGSCLGEIDQDPLFLDPFGLDGMIGTLDDNLRVSFGSPAVDAGNNIADLDGAEPGTTTISDIPTDLEGNPRIVGESIDLGAFELTPPPLLYVHDDASGANDGLSWTNAFNDLQSALFVSGSGTQIWVAEGVYVPGTSESDSFQLKEGVKIYGGFEGLSGSEGNFGARDPSAFLTILSGDIGGDDTTNGKAVVTDTADIVGDNIDHVVSGDRINETTVLDGFTITAGQADNPFPDSQGGGMLNDRASPTLSNLTFIGNSAMLRGGGLVNRNESDASIENVTFISNSTAGNGGGMYTIDSSPTLMRVTFYGNSADQDGGGLLNFESHPLLVNVLFSGNSAGGNGGGLNNNDANPILTNVTISANSASGSGGGMFTTDNGDPIVQNCIFWGNDAGVNGNQINNNIGTPIIANSLVQDSGGSGASWNADLGTDGGGNLDMDPLFVDFDGLDEMAGTLDDDVRLSEGSPAVNQGSNTADLDGSGSGTTTISDVALDLDGNFRIAEGIVDMGAYEFGSVGITGCDLSENQRVDAEDLILLLMSSSPDDVDLLFFARCWFEDLAP